MSDYKHVKIARRAADRLDGGHVWVYTSDIVSTGGAEPGHPVYVHDPKGRFLGTAFYSSTSQIGLRLVSRQRIAIDGEFFERRIRAAESYRRQVVDNTNAFRLIYSEADQLPGLIVDRYGDCLVVQLSTQAIDRFEPEILKALDAVSPARGIVLRNNSPVRSKEGLTSEVRVIGDVPEELEIEMNGFRWTADLRSGQKTGLFLDQRENYQQAAQYARGRGLDCFSSTGGFALHLARKCDSVEAIDASEPATERARRNADRNGIANIDFRCGNVFDLLAAHAGNSSRFDTIVLDPPAFAKSKANLDKALAGYKEINLKALRLLAPGGVLVTCSCSHHLSEVDFLGVMAAAALDAQRTLRIVERRAQSRDHPILLTVPETLYLKCVIAQAM